MKLRNLWLVFKDQLPLSRLYRNFFVTRNGRGVFHINSHISQGSGKPKVEYPKKESAERAALAMQKKHNNAAFRPYKCLFCDGYHIGKNKV